MPRLQIDGPRKLAMPCHAMPRSARPRTCVFSPPTVHAQSGTSSARTEHAAPPRPGRRSPRSGRARRRPRPSRRGPRCSSAACSGDSRAGSRCTPRAARAPRRIALEVDRPGLLGERHQREHPAADPDHRDLLSERVRLLGRRQIEAHRQDIIASHGPSVACRNDGRVTQRVLHSPRPGQIVCVRQSGLTSPPSIGQDDETIYPDLAGFARAHSAAM